jgi:hypothetical protein
VESIYKFVAAQRDSYRSDTIQITEGYDFSQYETLRTIELYHNSKFLSGNKDPLDREKPFFNICKFRVNVAVRSTDLDTKDVQIQSDRTTKTSYVESFLLNLKNRNWMQDSGFARFLNKFGQTRAKYGGVLVMRTENDDGLKIHVVPWLDMVTDQVDIRNGVKIERHYYTPAQLKTEAPKGWKNIDKAIDTAKKSREAQAANLGQKNKTPGKNIEVWEIHGVLPTCLLAGTSEKYPENYGDENEYERQMHVVVLEESDKSKESKVGGVTLYAGVEDEDPYKYLSYEEVDGRGLGVGVVEDLFEAQVWTNDSVMKKKDMLEIAGKIILQTSDGNIAARNILNEMENGHIVITAQDKPLTQVNNTPNSLPAFDKLIDEWNTQAERVSSTPAAITGETMPSGQPFRLAAMLNSEAGSLFEYRREEAGIFISEMYNDWVLPFIVKQIKKDKELTATLEPEEQKMVADMLADHEANSFAKSQILSGNLVHPDDMAAVKDSAKNGVMINRRHSFADFDNLFKDWEGNVSVDTTGEQRNKSVMMETLFNVFQIVAKNPAILQDPTLARIFNQMVEIAGVSPVFLSNDGGPAIPAAPAAQMPAQIAPAAV